MALSSSPHLKTKPQAKPKILILFCGGTLIMQESKDGALVVQEKDDAIQAILDLEPKLNDVCGMEVAYIDNIDSTNMRPEHWDKMLEVLEKKYDDYDGFVITHGTDTMAYTASALSYAIQDLGKPIVLTGAQIPGGKLETDARRNFVNAMSVAMLNLSGIFIVFDEEVILGSRASKVSESKLDAFETMNWDLMGEIRIDIRLSDECKPRSKSKPKFLQGFEPNIAVLALTPGFPVKVLLDILDSGVKGLVFSGYGPGNIAYEYLEAIQKAGDMKIPIVVTTQCIEGSTSMHLYDVGKKALDMGCIQAYDMSLESVTTKLMWALKHHPYDKIRDIMHTNYTGEINVEGKIY